MAVVRILLSLSVVYGLASAQPSSLKVESHCSPSSKVNISCGERRIINETLHELSMADGYGYVVSYDYLNGGHHLNYPNNFYLYHYYNSVTQHVLCLNSLCTCNDPESISVRRKRYTRCRHIPIATSVNVAE